MADFNELKTFIKSVVLGIKINGFYVIFDIDYDSLDACKIKLVLEPIYEVFVRKFTLSSPIYSVHVMVFLVCIEFVCSLVSSCLVT